MSRFESYQENTFEKFCAHTINNHVSNCRKSAKRKQSKVVNYGTDDELTVFSPLCEDTYCTFEKVFYVNDIPVTVKDEALANCLQYIVPSRRNVILLSFFLGYKKTQIAKCLGISNPTVAYRLRVGKQELREQLERSHYET